MLLTGLPDFYQPISENGLHLFSLYQNSRNYFILPDRLNIAETVEGLPDFHLEFIRGSSPFLPPEPYGWLDFRVTPSYRIDEALEILQTRQPTATLTPIRFTGGFLHFHVLGNEQDSADELQQPLILTSNGLNQVRLSDRISSGVANLLKSALQSEVLTVSAIAQLEWIGVSPRLPLQVSFDPAELLEIFVTLANEQRQLSWQTLVQYIAAEWQSLPWEIVGSVTQPLTLASAIADRVRQRFGTFIPTRTDFPQFTLAIGESGRFLWDLSQAVAVPRALKLELNPIDAARQLVEHQGLEAVLSETIVPPLSTGFQRLEIVANLPKNLQGVLSVGVNLRVEPQLPFRPQAQVKTVEFQPSHPLSIVDFRFGTDRLEYNYTTYIIIRDARGIEQLTAQQKITQNQRLYLTPRDFPVEFIPVEADADLLEIAILRGLLDRGDVQEEFELNLEQSEITLTLPQNTADATLSITAESRTGLGEIKLEKIPARGFQIGQYSFREFGRQIVAVECVFAEDTSPVIFEFLPEGEPETRRQPLFFSPSQPQQQWSWNTRSLFEYRYRYRRHSTSTWSDYQSPFVPLTILL